MTRRDYLLLAEAVRVGVERLAGSAQPHPSKPPLPRSSILAHGQGCATGAGVMIQALLDVVSASNPSFDRELLLLNAGPDARHIASHGTVLPVLPGTSS